jgi:hypothetical protein
MACECLAFALGSVLRILAVVFSFIEFTKNFVMVFRLVTFFIAVLTASPLLDTPYVVKFISGDDDIPK